MNEINYQTICEELLENLPQRQKQVLLRRFGLGQDKTETLQKIGNDLGITRERVRQLEKSGFLRLKDFQDNKNLKKAFDYFEKFLNENSGLKREDIFLEKITNKQKNSCAYFLLVLGDNFYRLGDDENLLPFWSTQKDKVFLVSDTVKKIKEFFHKEKTPITLEDLILKIYPECHPEAKQKDIDSEILRSAQNDKAGIFDRNFLKACLEIAKDIEISPLQKYGLSAWPEIKPKGVRDAAFLVLKKQGVPLHFRLIAKEAGELQGDIFTKRKMLPQTIHNELIRDKRFILVGRGIYGLSDWGYSTGTVKDVIYKVLQVGTPMGKDEILEAVQKQRIVKPNTIFLNLSDKKLFLRDQEGKYTLKSKIA